MTNLLTSGLNFIAFLTFLNVSVRYSHRRSSIPHDPRMNTTHNPSAPKPALTLIGLLKPYSGWIAMLILFTILSNAFNLAIPTIIARGIDAYTLGHFVLQTVIVEFTLAALAVFVFGSIQNIIQTYASERVARDLRAALSEKISVQSYAFVQGITPGKLLTNLTSDVDAVKQFVAMAVATMVSSVFLIIGASVLLLILDWKLAIAVLAILPVIMITFFLIFRKIRVLFKRTQEIIDWLNKVINESILGSALIRVLNSQQQEADKFLAANTDARNVGLSILRLFASLVPVISFVGNFAVLIILVLGGHFVITGAMTLGSFAAFNAYLAILIFPIVIIGFISTIIARSTASYKRITDVLESEERKETGTIKATIEGAIEVKNVSVLFGERAALKDISFSVQPHTKTAIIGPTGAGKTQLLYLLTGLIQPSSGTVLYDGHPLTDFDAASFHRQVGLVFEDSALFNICLLYTSDAADE